MGTKVFSHHQEILTVPSTQPAGHSHLVAAAVNLNHPDRYFHWGFIIVSLANLIVIAVLIALFIAAMAVPFIRPRPVPSPEVPEVEPESRPGVAGATDRTWTGAVRRVGLRFLPPAKLLPDHQPAYVASWAYVFGVGTLTALVVVVCSGLALAF